MTVQFDPIKNELSYYGVARFNRTTPFFVSRKDGHLYDLQTTVQNERNFHIATHASLMKISTGAGHDAKILHVTRVLEPGEHALCLKPMLADKRTAIINAIGEGFVRRILCKVAKIATTIDTEKKEPRPIEEIRAELSEREGLFYDTTTPVAKEDLKQLGQPFAKIMQILTDGVTYDRKLLFCMATTLVQVRGDNLNPHDAMPYAPHGIALTNPKTGKSTLARRLSGEPPVEKPSEAGLLGFADAEKKVPGKLQLREKPTFLDELQEEKGDQLLGKLFSYLEVGQFEQPRGIGISVKGFSPIIFMGNPINQAYATDYDLARTFREFIAKVSNNYQAFGSRIGWMLYGKFHEVRSNGLPDSTTAQVGEWIIRSYAENYSGEFTSTLKRREVSKWLNEPHADQMKSTITSISNGIGDEAVRQFLMGQTENHRHVRGAALRVAWLRVGLPAVISGEKIPMDALLEDAAEAYGELMTINLASYQELASGFGEETTLLIRARQLESLAPRYLRIGLYAVLEASNGKERLIPVASLAGHYQTAYVRDGVETNHFYSRFSNFKEQIGKCASFEPLRPFGVGFDKQNDCFVIEHPEEFQKTKKIYDSTSSTSSTPPNETNTSTSSTSSTEEEKVCANCASLQRECARCASASLGQSTPESKQAAALDWLRSKAPQGTDVDVFLKHTGLSFDDYEHLRQMGDLLVENFSNGVVWVRAS